MIQFIPFLLKKPNQSYDNSFVLSLKYKSCSKPLNAEKSSLLIWKRIAECTMLVFDWHSDYQSYLSYSNLGAIS